MTSPPLLIRGGMTLLGPRLTRIADAATSISDGAIAAAGPAEHVDAPEGAEVIDARSLTLAPGFIDAHVHIGFFEPRLLVAGGVTTARDLAWPPERIFPLAEASRADDFDGPTVVAAGPMLTVAGGYPLNAAWAPEGTGWPLESESDARRAVDEMAERGAAVIKIALDPHVGPTLSKKLVAAVVHAAHERHLKVTAHIYGLDELDKALEAGIDELAHMLMSTEEIPDHAIERMVEREIAVVPTLSVRSGRDLDVAIDNLRRFVSAGGRVIYGTDLGNEGPGPGIDRSEVTAMAGAGMAPHDIIRSATVDAAAWLGLERVGSLEKGASADIVGFAGDPLARVEDLCAPPLVVRRGRVVKAPA